MTSQTVNTDASQLDAADSSPPASTASSPGSFAKRRSRSPLSIDLSSIPPLTQPAPPSNTLLITQLDNLEIFHPASLATIRQHIHSVAPLHSFAPLKSLRRIICSFMDVDSAIRVRQHLDGASLLGNTRTRVYFGEPTLIGEQTKYLDRPDAGRLFFISPPPSPPVGWEMRHEDPPNKEVHASDLADALSKLSGKFNTAAEDEEQRQKQQSEQAGIQERMSDIEESPRSQNRPTYTAAGLASATAALRGETDSPTKSGFGTNGLSAKNRSRSSTLIYDPEAHGDSPGLPAVMVEDFTMDDDHMDEDQGGSAMSGKFDLDGAFGGRKIIAHTSRPPLELMAGSSQ